MGFEQLDDGIAYTFVLVLEAVHTFDHPPFLVILEPVLARLKTADDPMPRLRRML